MYLLCKQIVDCTTCKIKQELIVQPVNEGFFHLTGSTV
jgi:hypothetical protein